MNSARTSGLCRRVLICAGVFSVVSCGDGSTARNEKPDKPKTPMSDYATKALEKSRIPAAEIKAKVKALIPAVEQKDIEEVKTLCSDLDALLSTNVMTIYYQAFAIEAKSGPEAASKHLADKLSDPAITDKEKRPIKALSACFEAKGTISTKDAVLIVLIIGLEVHFPHGGANVFLAPFMDDGGKPKSEEAPKGDAGKE